jgi:hypothetical protein
MGAGLDPRRTGALGQGQQQIILKHVRQGNLLPFEGDRIPVPRILGLSRFIAQHHQVDPNLERQGLLTLTIRAALAPVKTHCPFHAGPPLLIAEEVGIHRYHTASARRAQGLGNAGEIGKGYAHRVLSVFSG